MKLKEAISKIEERYTLAQAEDFDNAGLLCGNPEAEVKGILIVHDALETVIQEAILKGTNLVVCFHPIIFSGLKSITGKNYVERAVMKALENKIAIYAIHTALDNDFHGVNERICKELGLGNTQILIPKKQNLKQLSVYVPQTHVEAVKKSFFDSGAGNIGFYDECSFSVSGTGTFRPLEGSHPFSGNQNERENVEEQMVSVIFENFKEKQIIQAMKSAHPYEEVVYQIYSLDNENQFSGLGKFGELENEISEEDFLKLLKSKFNLQMIRHSSFTGKKIKKVAVLGGSGASAIRNAMAAKCDAYVTGDLKYHDFFSAEDQILLCDIGHFESEQFVIQQIFEDLSEKFHKFAVLKSEVKTNPVNYFI